MHLRPKLEILMLSCMAHSNLAGAILLPRAAIVLARRLRISADIHQGRLVTIGFGDSDNLAAVVCSHSLDIDFTGALLAL